MMREFLRWGRQRNSCKVRMLFRTDICYETKFLGGVAPQPRESGVFPWEFHLFRETMLSFVKLLS